MCSRFICCRDNLRGTDALELIPWSASSRNRSCPPNIVFCIDMTHEVALRCTSGGLEGGRKEIEVCFGVTMGHTKKGLKAPRNAKVWRVQVGEALENRRMIAVANNNKMSARGSSRRKRMHNNKL